MSILSRSYFHDEDAAFAFLESILWAEGPVCGKCGCSGRITKVKPNAEKRIRIGLYRCGDCKGQFRVTVGTVFEHIRLPLHKCLQAAHLMCSSKKGISAHQISRTLEVQYKTASFLCHRIREAVREDGTFDMLGGANRVVEADETYIGGKVKNRAHREPKPKKPVLPTSCFTPSMRVRARLRTKAIASRSSDLSDGIRRRDDMRLYKTFVT